LGDAACVCVQVRTAVDAVCAEMKNLSGVFDMYRACIKLKDGIHPLSVLGLVSFVAQ
jgi:hypothetical protein